MASVDQLLKALDSAMWEMSEAFSGLQDADVWRRADPRLLSVGELAAHIAYGEADSFFGKAVDSPLVASQIRYYPYAQAEGLTLEMGAAEVLAEVQRIHALCKEKLAAEPHDSEDPNPYREGWTWGYVLEYMAFHVAYHTGQMYSVRHLMGHETADN